MSKNEIEKSKLSLPEILAANAADLTPEQAELRIMYLRAKDSEEAELDQIRQPDRLEVAHQQQMFKLPDGSGVPNVKVVILGFVKARQCYDESTEDGAMYCSSIGGVSGKPTADGREANPYLDRIQPICMSCPFDQWGSGKTGSGKQCKELRRNLVFINGFKDPMLFSVPPTGLKDYDNYRRKVDKSGRLVYGLWTKISLVKMESGVYKWSKFVFEAGDDVTPEEFKMAFAAREAFKDSIQQDVNEGDYRMSPIHVETDPENDDPPDPGTDDDLPF